MITVSTTSSFLLERGVVFLFNKTKKDEPGLLQIRLTELIF